MEAKGLSTPEALQKLLVDLEDVIHQEEIQDSSKGRSDKKGFYLQLLQKSLQIREPLCTFNWISFIVLGVEIVAMVVAYGCHERQQSKSLLWEAFFLLLLTGFNVVFACWDTRLRQTEMRTRVEWLLNFLYEWKDKCEWTAENYPHIHSPQSPSITLQPTIRDGNIVHLPWALLVKGDVIVLRPGQPSPGRCKNLKIPGRDESDFVLEPDEVYAPLTDSDKAGPFNTPLLRKPLPCAYCILEETPYIQSVRIALKEALNRPTGVLHKEKFLCFAVCLEQFVAPIFLVLMLVFNAGRYFYFSDHLSTGHWTDMFLVQPCLVVLPLLPLVLPLTWLLINVYGVALILALFYTARHFKVSNDPFEDAEVTAPTHSSFWVKCREMWPYFLDTLIGRGKSPFRTENLFQTLSSVTALCCVDKKGILSWPNPTAEKVFFLRNGSWGHQQTGFTEENVTLEPSATSTGAILKKGRDNARRTRKRLNKRGNTDQLRGAYETRAEVLDLSHDCTTPFRLQFDDPSWQQYMGSLKPLGLAILLNTCNPSTQERYAQFCSHLSCLSKFHEDFVPVTNRREWDDVRAHLSMCDSSRTTITSNLLTHGCLCELAKQIGFQNTARNIFSLKDQLFIFRHQADPSSRKDRLARSLSLPKLKFPFPNMVGVCVQESNSGRYQLLSQGTGEILLDACVDYWNGVDLCPLTLADRKRILDFYNRSSLTAYCTAFAYRPVDARFRQTTVCGGADRMFNSSGVYLELPTDSSHLYQPQRSPTPADTVSLSRIQSDGNLYCGTTAAGYYSRSNDSVTAESPKEPSPDSPEGVFQLQCNQTFVGMVTMQYQARTDMVQLIEQLDKASVRFVHFSKENELRSRVFSEKMGLESGWNCHISLLSDSGGESKEEVDEACKRRNNKSTMSLVNKEELNPLGGATKNQFGPLEHCRPLSISAPSAINVEMAQVKFEDEIFLHSLTDDDSQSENSDTDLLKDEDRDGLFHSHKSPVSVKTPSPQRHHLVNCSSTASSLERCCSTSRSRSRSRSRSTSQSRSSSSSSSSSSSVLLNVAGGGGSSCWDINLSRSQSHVTESTEQSAPVAFDLTNRAKLPRGIEEIRPHIENVDNVPLLVSLFTESTPAATREMIKIMQEYGEVVCIVGSSASAYNCAIFMQADASLAVEPLYPQVCQQVPVFSPTTQTNTVTPAELSRRLNSLPCALSFHRDELSSLLHLVLESRHVGICLRNVLQLWAASIASLSAVQLGAALLFLPPIFTTGQVIWFTCIIIPLLCVSLMGAPTDPGVMNIATGKNSRKVDKDTFSFVMWSYGLKFLPSMFVLLIVYGATLFSFCSYVSQDCQTVSTCSWVYPSVNGTVLKGVWSGWGEPIHQPLLYTIQLGNALAFVVYLAIISLSFVHRQHHFWQINPFNNQLWIVCSGLVVVLQLIYFSLAIWVTNNATTLCPLTNTGYGFPLPAWLLLVWPAPLIGLNELVKYYEIKVNVRLQKRARLEFGTKLGMNSPF